MSLRIVLPLVLLSCTGNSRVLPEPQLPFPPQVVLLVSLDGFRWDYIDRPAAVELRKLAARGVRATRMTPVFPTKTFPNHYTMVTGLYPEHHGIVANTMWDEVIGATFSLGAPAVMADPRWWGGEPLWVAAVKQGKRSACFFWPGSNVQIAGTYCSYYRNYDAVQPHATRVQQILDWLALPGDSAPVFATLYFSNVDGAGHSFGPDAPQIDSAITRVDSAVGALVRGFAARGLEDRVNLIIVADHGMTATSPDRQIFLDDYIDTADVRVVEWSPVASIIPKPGREQDVYQALLGRHPQLAVYRKADIPARWHYQNHPRITPIIAVAAEGWHITTRAQSMNQAGGTHGYDDTLTSMGALFIAAGPAFRQGIVVEPFRNVHLYELIARITGLTPAPNDGSLDSVRALLR
jgi:predicted AlkP superfamily pyrophosphatase or phosphodiesterase